MRPDAYSIVLAGGKGERFWPLSTTRCPKQMLSLVGNKPLIASAVGLLKTLMPEDHIFVITNSNLVPAIREALPSLPYKNVVGEPTGRDTAAAITLGAALIRNRDPNASFCVLTADHVIGDIELFNRTILESFDLAAASHVLITIGMKPSFASTGFGYIEESAHLEHAGMIEFSRVKRFVEKPDLATAERYVKSGRFFWNSGMFIWSVKTYEAALTTHCPALLEILHRIGPTVGGPRFPDTMASVYAGLEKISIDYALMEKAENIVMAKGTFAWDDVGSWTALENHLEKDASGNTVLGEVETIDSSGNVIIADQGLIALCGINNIVVVRTGDATLVCPKDRAQDVKRIVELLKTNERYKKLI